MSLTTAVYGAGAARTIAVVDQVPTVRGRLLAPVPLVWTGKDPVQTVTRQVDLAAILGDRAITDVSVAATGVTLAWSGYFGTVVTAILRGGADGQVGSVQLRAFCDDLTDEAVAVQIPVATVLTLPSIDQSEPIYPTLGGRFISFLGRPISAGRSSPVALPT